MQSSNFIEERNNPLADLIDDEVYELLNSRGFIDQKSVRDYQIKKKFRLLRAKKLSTGDAIDALREDYPYLQFDSLRKIVYQSPKY